jgi:predicted chitinase
MKIAAKVPTKLKKAPIDSAFLTPTEFVSVPVGKIYGVISAIAAKNGHTQVTLDGGAGTWFVFTAHWDGWSPQIVSRTTAEYIFQNTISDALLADLNSCLNRYNINTPQRLRHFSSQIAHESAGLKYLKEIDSGWYIPENFNLPAIAASDGCYKYRGAGVIQLSMPDNYLAFSKAMGDPKIYDQGCPYVAQTYPVTSAGFWWFNNDMNALCDRNPTVEQVTRRVNGGDNGLSDREYYYARACNVI